MLNYLEEQVTGDFLIQISYELSYNPDGDVSKILTTWYNALYSALLHELDFCVLLECQSQEVLDPYDAFVDYLKTLSKKDARKVSSDAFKEAH